jgi:pimeloyl-ACP methyl ester carboxylesterase
MLKDGTPASTYTGARRPTLLLSGTASPLPARRVVQRLAEALPESRVVTIEGAGHLAPVTRAGDVNRAVVAALQAAGAC